jgi:hypothetical protein
MNVRFLILCIGCIIAFIVADLKAAVDSTFHCYLLFGQSNMAGGGAGVSLGGSGSGTLITADCDTSTRVKVLAFCDCSSGSGTACTQYSSVRTANTWYTAFPALHICNEGVSPGDWFAKTMLDSIRSDIKIGLIPCALSGQSISVFVKGGSGFSIPTWAHPTLGDSSPYAWMLAKCKLAQKTGVIKGFLFHQGESDNGSSTWIPRLKGVLDSLKKDLGLDSTLPVIVGELRQDAAACCAGHNKLVDSMAKIYPKCAVASSLGLSAQSDDEYHFDPAGMRELGKRYAKALLSLSSESYIARKNSSGIIYNERTALYNSVKSAKSDITVYSINGRAIRSIPADKAVTELHNLNARGVYIVSRKLANGNTIMLPYINQ